MPTMCTATTTPTSLTAQHCGSCCSEPADSLHALLLLLLLLLSQGHATAAHVF
jgi:Fe-S-cluster containining protein